MRAEYRRFTSEYPQQTPNPVPPKIAGIINHVINPQYQFQVPEQIIKQIELSCQRCDENNSDLIVICSKCYQAYVYSRQSLNPPTFSQHCPIQNPNYPVSHQQYAHGAYPVTTTPSFENVRLPSYPVPSQQHNYQFPAPIPNNFSSPIAHDSASPFATPPSFENVQLSSIPIQIYPVRDVTASARQTFDRHFTSLREEAIQKCRDDVDDSGAQQSEDPIIKKRKITADRNSHEQHSKNTETTARKRLPHRKITFKL